MKQAFKKSGDVTRPSAVWRKRLLTSALGLAVVTGSLACEFNKTEKQQETSAVAQQAVEKPQEKLPVYEARTEKDIGGCYGLARHDHSEHQELSTLLDVVRDAAPIGRALYEEARKRDIFFCIDDVADKENNLSRAGGFLPDAGIVILDHSTREPLKTLVLVHEKTHAAQKALGGDVTLYSDDVETVIRRTLYTEAAARVAEVLFAFQAKLNGKNEMWNVVKTLEANYYKSLSRVIEKEYKAAESDGKEPQEALIIAGSRAWEKMFENTDWKDFYIRQKLGFYMREINKGSYAHRPAVSRSLSGIATKSGNIEGYLNFTALVKEPDYDEIFSDSPELEKVMWALEAARFRQSYGPRDAASNKFIRSAKQSAAPYGHVDFKTVERFMQEHKLMIDEGVEAAHQKQKMTRTLKVPNAARPSLAG